MTYLKREDYKEYIEKGYTPIVSSYWGDEEDDWEDFFDYQEDCPLIFSHVDHESKEVYFDVDPRNYDD